MHQKVTGKHSGKKYAGLAAPAVSTLFPNFNHIPTGITNR